MKVESHHEVFEQKAAAAFTEALDEAVEYSQSIAPRKSGRYAASIKHTAPRADARGYSAAIGATVSSARAKELGAYITPKRAPRLVFDAGQGVRQAEAVRLPARPVIGRTVRRWPEIIGGAFKRRLGR